MSAPDKQGYLGKSEQHGKKWITYWVSLRAGILFFFKTKDTSRKDQIVGHLTIDECGSITPQPPRRKVKGSIFVVPAQSGQYFLEAENDEARTEWIAAINQSVSRKRHRDSIAVNRASRHGQGNVANHPSHEEPPSTSGSLRSLPLPPLPAKPESPKAAKALQMPSSPWFNSSDPNDKHSWYFGKTPRVKAEDVLERHGSDGTFLIRASESQPGDYSLSVVDEKRAKHFKITTRPDRMLELSGCPGESFADLSDLVAYYCRAQMGYAVPLDKYMIEKMRTAFEAPAVIDPAMVLPGLRPEFAVTEPKPSIRGRPPPRPTSMLAR